MKLVGIGLWVLAAGICGCSFGGDSLAGCSVGRKRSCTCEGKQGTEVCKDEGESFGPYWGECDACPPPKKSKGEQCLADYECASGLFCQGSQPFAMATKACADLPGGGENCSADGVPCATGLACNFATLSSKCQEPGIEGSLCDDALPCGAGLECNFAWKPRQCRPPGKSGDPCYGKPPSSCSTGLVCNWSLDPDPERGLCAEPGELGALCAQTSDCSLPLACVDGQCASQ